MLKDHHQKVLRSNVTETYQKAPFKLEALIKLEAKGISTKPKIRNALQGHLLPWHILFNESIKNALGKVSKQVLEKINFDISSILQFNQWHNTDDILKWFRNITDKSSCSFIQFDFKEFYLSITKNILHQTLKFAKQHTNNKNNLPIVNYCHKSWLFSDNNTWKKKLTDSFFDITVGSFDGTGIYELVGIYVQSKLEKMLSNSNFVLYLEDRLALLRNLNEQQTDKFRKEHHWSI